MRVLELNHVHLVLVELLLISLERLFVKLVRVERLPLVVLPDVLFAVLGNSVHLEQQFANNVQLVLTLLVKMPLVVLVPSDQFLDLGLVNVTHVWPIHIALQMELFVSLVLSIPSHHLALTYA
jgi:hypothetical protein